MKKRMTMLAFFCAGSLYAAIFQVGVEQTYTTVADAIGAASSGDTIRKG